MFMKYFLGYSGFSNKEPFSDTLFVEIRKRLSIDLVCKINEVIALYCIDKQEAGIQDQQESVNKKQNAPPIQNSELLTCRKLICVIFINQLQISTGEDSFCIV
jgi:hypothetical protein